MPIRTLVWLLKKTPLPPLTYFLLSLLFKSQRLMPDDNSRIRLPPPTLSPSLSVTPWWLFPYYCNLFAFADDYPHIHASQKTVIYKLLYSRVFFESFHSKHFEQAPIEEALNDELMNDDDSYLEFILLMVKKLGGVGNKLLIS